MPRLTSIMRDLKYYLIPLAVLWIAVAGLLLLKGDEGSFIFLNRQFVTWLDYPMLTITFLGDSVILSAIVTLLLVRKNPGLVLLVIIAVACTGLFGQLLKLGFFSHQHRPLKVFENRQTVHTVGNYRLYHRSFPSGHSITVACAFCLISFLYRKNRYVVWLCLLFTAIISYSRIYTGVHFPGDVLAGSIIGATGAVLFIMFYYNRLSGFFSNMTNETQNRWKFWLYVLAATALCISVRVSIITNI